MAEDPQDTTGTLEDANSSSGARSFSVRKSKDKKTRIILEGQEGFSIKEIPSGVNSASAYGELRNGADGTFPQPNLDAEREDQKFESQKEPDLGPFGSSAGGGQEIEQPVKPDNKNAENSSSDVLTTPKQPAENGDEIYKSIPNSGPKKKPFSGRNFDLERAEKRYKSVPDNYRGKDVDSPSESWQRPTDNIPRGAGENGRPNRGAYSENDKKNKPLDKDGQIDYDKRRKSDLNKSLFSGAGRGFSEGLQKGRERFREKQRAGSGKPASVAGGLRRGLSAGRQGLKQGYKSAARSIYRNVLRVGSDKAFYYVLGSVAVPPFVTGVIGLDILWGLSKLFGVSLKL